MATIDSPERVQQIIDANGQIHPREPIVVKIVKYHNAWGGISFGLIFRGEDLDKYHETDYVQRPETIWQRACDTCGARGFEPSRIGPERCQFCDGTFGGVRN